MSAERITAEMVRQIGGSNPSPICDCKLCLPARVADQMVADAQRLAEVERDYQKQTARLEAVKAYAASLRADAEVQHQRIAVMEATLEGTEAERDKAMTEVDALRADANAARGHLEFVENRLEKAEADAAEWRALQAVIGHPMRNSATRVSWNGLGWGTVLRQDGSSVSAPTPTALLARLDALAEAAKPKPETWRWRWSNGKRVCGDYASADEARRSNPMLTPGTPVRETVNPDGSILLTPEAT